MVEEKIIIKSERYSIKKMFMWFAIIAAIVGLILWFAVCSSDCSYYVSEHKEGVECDDYACGGSLFSCVINRLLFEDLILWICIIPVSVILLIGLFFCLLLKSMEIVVTDKRVYGKTYFGRMVDLPLDSVSAVGSAWFKGIAVATSSGKISFLLIKNAREIHEEIRKLLIERQEKKEQAQVDTPAVAPTINNGAEELKKYKELLDSGIITQEEFDAKKKQILGL